MGMSLRERAPRLNMPRKGVLWHQTLMLTHANMKSRYRNTVSGFLWVVLKPLILYGTQSLVFMKFLRLDVPNYPTFLATGLLPWIFISQTLDMCTSILVNNGQLMKALTVHPLVYLAAQIADNLFNFMAAFLLILIPLNLTRPIEPAAYLFLPVAVALLGMSVAGIAWFLAICQVFLRDTRYVITFAQTVFFFVTPTFYPAEFVPQSYRWLVDYNPYYRLIQPFRHLLYRFDLRAFGASLPPALAVSALFLVLGTALWTRKRNAIYLNI